MKHLLIKAIAIFFLSTSSVFNHNLKAQANITLDTEATADRLLSMAYSREFFEEDFFRKQISTPVIINQNTIENQSNIAKTNSSIDQKNTINHLLINVNNAKDELEKGKIKNYTVGGNKIYDNTGESLTINEVNFSAFSKGKYYMKIYEETGVYSKEVLVP